MTTDVIQLLTSKKLFFFLFSLCSKSVKLRNWEEEKIMTQKERKARNPEMVLNRMLELHEKYIKDE